MNEWRRDHKRVKRDFGGEKRWIWEERWSARARSNRAKQWEKAQKSLSKVAIFGGEEEGEVPRTRSLDLEQKGIGEVGFWKEEDDRMSWLTNRIPYKNNEPVGSLRK